MIPSLITLHLVSVILFYYTKEDGGKDIRARFYLFSSDLHQVIFFLPSEEYVLRSRSLPVLFVGGRRVDFPQGVC
jgi:hypothetical protein